MKRNILAIISAAVLFAMVLASCSSNRSVVASNENGGKNVAYTLARNYFFRNDAKIPADPKITSQAQLESLFGMATHMGADGRPTEINFKKQMGVAIVLPETDRATEIKVNSVSSNGQQVTVNYDVVRGEHRSYSIQPMELLIIDSKYADNKIILLQNDK